MTDFPVVLMGSDYWQPLLEWLRQKMVAERTIGVEDLGLLRVTDSVEEAVTLITERTIESASRARRVAETPKPLLGESRPQRAA
jgi:predicted Rossmann-fold nucleotide-binding protein